MSRPIKPRQAPPKDDYEDNPMRLFLDIDKKDIIAPAKIQRMEVIKDG